MGIQINGNTDSISASDGGLSISGADIGSASASSLNISGIVTANGGLNVTGGNVGIGTDDSQIELQIETSGGLQAVNTQEIALRYNVYYDGSNDRYIQGANKAASLVLDTNGSFLFYNTNTASSSANSTIAGWTQQVKIDSNGYMSVPNQPAFRATREGSAATITSAVRLPYNSTSANGGFDNTNSYDTSTFAFTAPVAGVYFFSASSYTNLNTDSMYDIRVNGLFRQRIEIRQSSGDDIGDNTIIHGNCIVKLEQNDVVDVLWASNTVELILGSGYIHFSGAKIS